MKEENRQVLLTQELNEELEKLLSSDNFSEEQKSLILKKIINDHKEKIERDV